MVAQMDYREEGEMREIQMKRMKMSLKRVWMPI